LEPKVIVADDFFARKRWSRRSWVIVCVAAVSLDGAIALYSLWNRDGWQAARALVRIAVFGFIGWTSWRDEQARARCPAVSLSDEVIKWWIGTPRHQHRVLLEDVVDVIPAAAPAWTPLGLRTRSRGTVWVSLDELSVDDQRQVLRALETCLSQRWIVADQPTNP